MALQFLYEALDSSGQSVIGKIAAVNEEDAGTKIAQMGCTVVSLHATPSTAPASVENVQATPAPHASLVSPAPPYAPVVQEAATHDVFRRTIMAAAPANEQQDTNESISQEDDYSMLVGQGPALVYQPVQSATPNQSAVNGTSASIAAAAQPRIILSGTAARHQTKVRTSTRLAAPGDSAKLKDPNAHLGSATNKDLMMFFRQLSTLINSGLSIYSALENLGPRTSNRALRTAASEMREAAKGGGAISAVMLKYPRVFPGHVAAMVAAGETGGFLEIALDELARVYEQNVALYRTSWIPKLLAVQAWYALMIALPLMPYFFSSFNLVNNVKAYAAAETFIWMPIAIAIHLAAIWFGRHLRLPKYRRALDKLALKVKPFGELQRDAALTSFLQVLHRLYNAGVAPIAAWECAMNTASNTAIRDKLAESYQIMHGGRTLPEAFKATGLFTSDVEQMIATGHHSGRLVEMLEHSTEFYMEEARVKLGKARFMMLRFGVLAALIMGGGAICWLFYSYFHGMFNYVNTYFSSYVLLTGGIASVESVRISENPSSRLPQEDSHA